MGLLVDVWVLMDIPVALPEVSHTVDIPHIILTYRHI